MLNRTTRVAASSRTLAMPWQSMLIKLGLVEMVASALLISSLLSGCSGGCSPENVPPPVIDRSKDPEYAKALRERMDMQRETASRGHKILRELEAARAEDPESEKTKELEKQYTEVAAELEKQRIINMAIVRERIEKEQADRAKAAADAKEKK